MLLLSFFYLIKIQWWVFNYWYTCRMKFFFIFRYWFQECLCDHYCSIFLLECVPSFLAFFGAVHTDDIAPSIHCLGLHDQRSSAISLLRIHTMLQNTFFIVCKVNLHILLSFVFHIVSSQLHPPRLPVVEG